MQPPTAPCQQAETRNQSSVLMSSDVPLNAVPRRVQASVEPIERLLWLPFATNWEEAQQGREGQERAQLQLHDVTSSSSPQSSVMDLEFLLCGLVQHKKVTGPTMEAFCVICVCPTH